LLLLIAREQLKRVAIRLPHRPTLHSIIRDHAINDLLGHSSNRTACEAVIHAPYTHYNDIAAINTQQI